MEDRFDLIVIGSGPGGYVAAIKAAKLGMKTAIVESREVGGTCLNRGCIPTKTLLHSSHLYYEAKNLQEAGIDFAGVSFDYGKILSHKDEVVGKIRQGIHGLLEANGITQLQGTGTILRVHNENHVVIKPQSGPMEHLQAKEYLACNILIATGSKPFIPGISGVGLHKVMTSDELLAGNEVLYQKLLIIGGGVIGVEFATIYRELGCEVEIIEAMDRILPSMDKEISQSIAMSLKKKGVTIHTKARVTGITEDGNGGLNCDYEEKDLIKITNAEGILISVGRKANTEELFGKDITLDMNGANISVNERFETSIPGIYAIGDVIGGKLLAHAASAQGIVAVEGMCDREASIDLKVIPSCIYTIPEVAVVGMNEAEAIAKGHRVIFGKYPMLGNSKTILSGGERGFIKVISDADTDKVLGAQLLCERASDMVSEFAMAISTGMTSKEMASVIRPHPTFSEAITEAVEDIYGSSIHLMPKQKNRRSLE
ncbi:MAG TPA: dihydrolipoyl dehydrogenase [Mobilitalea sp.]|nr:dihydrolipoyl dehydrogenase [Mobilitalea sp.]